MRDNKKREFAELKIYTVNSSVFGFKLGYIKWLDSGLVIVSSEGKDHTFVESNIISMEETL
ncbi:MAG: hypothetical protein LBU89_00785 [Fibromonadaceae bacterium]|jgi:hypothetical protein|nr:hypothetical protein [Fibromonadaceae bacterium]